MSKSTAERKADERARRDKEGLARFIFEDWVPKEKLAMLKRMRPKLQAYVKRLMGKDDG